MRKFQEKWRPAAKYIPRQSPPSQLRKRLNWRERERKLPAIHVFDSLQYFFGRGKPSLLFLGKYLYTVYSNIEYPATGLDYFWLDTELLLDRFRQTGGLRIIVSNNTVFYRYFHLVYSPSSRPKSKPKIPLCHCLCNAIYDCISILSGTGAISFSLTETSTFMAGAGSA